MNEIDIVFIFSNGCSNNGFLLKNERKRRDTRLSFSLLFRHEFSILYDMHHLSDTNAVRVCAVGVKYLW